jgi:hypothetical protein
MQQSLQQSRVWVIGSSASALRLDDAASSALPMLAGTNLHFSSSRGGDYWKAAEIRALMTPKDWYIYTITSNGIKDNRRLRSGTFSTDTSTAVVEQLFA